jgi:hypothetical protein
MTTDTRTIEQIDADIAALNDARKAKLDASKQADLETVRKLCKQHGFTATQLRGSLATKGKKKSTGDTAAKKPAAKKAPAKKTTKAK